MPNTRGILLKHRTNYSIIDVDDGNCVIRGTENKIRKWMNYYKMTLKDLFFNNLSPNKLFKLIKNNKQIFFRANWYDCWDDNDCR